MTIEFGRQKLYEEVWAVPLTQLARKYDLSDNGLRKICKAMEIPLPKAGHWAKVAAGHVVGVPPLPATAGRTTFISNPTKPEERKFELPQDADWLAQRLAFDATAENQIAFDPKPRRWHAAVDPLRARLHKALEELEADRREGERLAKRPPPRMGPIFHGHQWRSFEKDGQVIVLSHKATPLRVTPLTYERALAILNVLCLASERRGFRATLGVSRERIELTGYDATISLRMSEQLTDEYRVEKPDWSDRPRRERTRNPTGRLRLYLGPTYNEVEISDTPDHPLEQKLSAVFVRIYRGVIRSWVQAREHAERLRQLKEQEERRAAEQKRRQEEAKQREEERRRQQTLIDDARAWETAALVRKYVAHVQTRAGNGGESKAFTAWVSWALLVADTLDPTETTLRASMEFFQPEGRSE